MEIIIVTGASSGLGREFVRQLSMGPPVDEIWVIARRKDRLMALAQEIPVPIRVLPLDLTEAESLRRLKRLLTRERPRVEVLVNAAGFGKFGDYSQISSQDVRDMIRLNCEAAVQVTLAVLPYMRKGGRVLEICSTSAFQPLPEMNLYSATKAFLYRFSRALHWELLGRGITVTAVCPYWIRDTEFIRTAKTTNAHAVKHFPLSTPCGQVVRRALQDSALGVSVSTPGLASSCHRVLAKLIPHEVMMAGWDLLRRV